MLSASLFLTSTLFSGRLDLIVIVSSTISRAHLSWDDLNFRTQHFQIYPEKSQPNRYGKMQSVKNTFHSTPL